MIHSRKSMLLAIGVFAAAVAVPFALDYLTVNAEELSERRLDFDSEDMPCKIEVKSASISLGEAPKIRVSITNTTDKQILLVGSTDGSGMNRRYPICEITITGPDGKDVNKAIRICGNMNALRPEDFVPVGPGATFDPYQAVDDQGFFPNIKLRPENFDIEGVYTLQFTYATDSDELNDWSPAPELNGPGQGFGLLKRVPRVRVQSNTVHVTVTNPDSSQGSDFSAILR